MSAGERGVTHVLTVAKELAPIEWPAEFVSMRLDVEDSEEPSETLLPYFDQCADFIDSARGLSGGCCNSSSAAGAVFVHCLAGRSRSVRQP